MSNEIKSNPFKGARRDFNAKEKTTDRNVSKTGTVILEIKRLENISIEIAKYFLILIE